MGEVSSLGTPTVAGKKQKKIPKKSQLVLEDASAKFHVEGGRAGADKRATLSLGREKSPWCYCGYKT